MQQGLLFHTLAEGAPGEYFTQVTCRLRGSLHPRALRQAWLQAVERHAVLRTAFRWQRLAEPLQMVRRDVVVPWEELDWRDLPVEEQAARWEALLAGDRALGFDLGRAPLLRLCLVRTGEQEYRLLWSHHHLLLDGWSLPLLLAEVFDREAALREGRELRLPPTRPYRELIAWLRGRDLSAAREFWRRELAGLDLPTRIPLPPPATGTGGAPFEAVGAPLAPGLADALGAFARRHRLTLNSVCEGAWALMLSRYCDERDVVFGGVSSGRPVDLAGVESTVGLFIDVLPLRVEVEPAAPLAA
jgi:hypothetical protein